MESQGVLSTMRECEWKQFLKDECDFPETRLHNILVRDTEETLLEAIQNEKIFGFIGKCF